LEDEPPDTSVTSPEAPERSERTSGSNPKRHHTVPRFYLERFSVDGQVELVDRSDFGKSFLIHIERALAENRFYSIETDEGGWDPEAEKFLATYVDAPASSAIRRMFDEGRPLNAPGPREIISMFLAFQSVRGARERHALVEHAKAVQRKMASMATPELVLRYARERGDEEMTEEEAADTAEFARAGEYTIKINREASLHLGAALPIIQHLAPMFFARSWQVLEFPEPWLVTSDEPVALVGADPDAPGSAGGFPLAREIVFPIDPQRALIMVRPDLADQQTRAINMGARQAQVINQHVAFNAHRFIVRKPGTNPLAGLTIPERAPAVFEVGDMIGMSTNQSVETRAKVVARMKAKQRKPRR
jgi:hypothetical protein